ncbi:MAG: hypothetical protein ACI9R3_005545, partial [Verrucomicrobiales bacterium]
AMRSLLKATARMKNDGADGDYKKSQRSDRQNLTSRTLFG